MPVVEGVRHHHVDLAGLRVHVAEAGAGAPLFLLHGWPQHWYCWHRLVPLLDGFRLVMPDTRGFGWSTAPEHGYEKDALVDDLLALMDALEIERAGIVGHDWGGWTGFLACLRTPERFTGLLAASITHPFVPLDVRTLAHSWRFGYQAAVASPLGPMLLRHPQVLDGLLAPEAAITDPSVYSRVIAQPERARASQQLYRTFIGQDLPRLRCGRSARLRVPTLLLVGDRDPVIRPSLLRGYEPRADRMSVEILPGVGHFVPEEAPIELATRARQLFGEWRREHGSGESSSARPNRTSGIAR